MQYPLAKLHVNKLLDPVVSTLDVQLDEVEGQQNGQVAAGGPDVLAVAPHQARTHHVTKGAEQEQVGKDDHVEVVDERLHGQWLQAGVQTI